MREYRLSVEEDELDDFEEGAHINVDDDMGDYGMDEEEEDDKEEENAEYVLLIKIQVAPAVELSRYPPIATICPSAEMATDHP